MKTTKKITLAVTLIVAQLFFVQCSPKADNDGNTDNSAFNINTVIEAEQFAKSTPNKTKIVIAKLGNDAGIIGAAMLGRGRH